MYLRRGDVDDAHRCEGGQGWWMHAEAWEGAAGDHREREGGVERYFGSGKGSCSGGGRCRLRHGGRDGGEDTRSARFGSAVQLIAGPLHDVRNADAGDVEDDMVGQARVGGLLGRVRHGAEEEKRLVRGVGDDVREDVRKGRRVEGGGRACLDADTGQGGTGRVG
jgi:hypothetical protein